MELVFYGHACFGIQSPEAQVLIDPFLRPNPANSELNLDRIPVSHLLLTHAHEDHVADAPEFAKREGVLTVANYELANWMLEEGATGVQHMNHGGCLKTNFGSIRMVNAVHSSTLADGRVMGNACGFIVEIGGKRIYHAGDTALTMDMELIGRHWKPDLAILPLGDIFTMGWEDALRASELIQCDNIIGMHFDTFPPITVSPEQKEEAISAFAASHRSLVFPQLNQRFRLK